MAKLTDILNGNGDFFDSWDDVDPAGDFNPLPKGWYVCHIIEGRLDQARTGAGGYKLTFQIVEGEHAGRRCWHDVWLTARNRENAKRDFNKLGITDPRRQLEQPLPRFIRCRVLVVLRKDDDGIERNQIRTFEVLGIDPPEADAFAPSEEPAAGAPEGGAE